MPDCCDYDREFSTRVARADLRRYQKKGLDDLERKLFDSMVETGVDGRSVLEVGGGVGALQVEFLKSGAASVTSVEMSSEYEGAANSLLHEEGFEGRVDRRIADFAESANNVPEADFVVLNRVVCCYPHLPELLAAAMGRARRLLAMTFPRERRLVRVRWALHNLLSRLRGEEFRAFLHPPDEIFRRAQQDGFEVAFSDQTAVWHTVVFARAA